MPGLRPSDTIPILDGPFRPNRALDQATRLAACAAPDNLVWQDDHLLFTSGRAVLLLEIMNDHDREVEQILRFESDVTAMAAAKDGSLAIGLAGGGIAIVGGEHDGEVLDGIAGALSHAATALCFADPHTVFACLEPGGSVWRLDLRGMAPIRLAEGLASPRGLLLRGKDSVVVSEAARCRLVECSASVQRPPRILVDGLPGYPGRLAPTGTNGIWLTISALREQEGRYGLVLRLNAAFEAEASLHGSADGRCRGVTSCLQTRHELIVACCADDALISVDLQHQSES